MKIQEGSIPGCVLSNSFYGVGINPLPETIYNKLSPTSRQSLVSVCIENISYQDEHLDL